MPQTNNIITPVERLQIASRQLAGMQAAGYIQSDEQIRLNVTTALQSTDELIKQSGCIVEREYQDEPEGYERRSQCMHERIGSDGPTSGSYCKDCGEEF